MGHVRKIGNLPIEARELAAAVTRVSLRDWGKAHQSIISFMMRLQEKKQVSQVSNRVREVVESSLMRWRKRGYRTYRIGQPTKCN